MFCNLFNHLCHLFRIFYRNLPQPTKRRKITIDPGTISSFPSATFVPTDDITTSGAGQSQFAAAIHIPHVLQGEIARLDQKFKVSLDPSTLATGTGSSVIKLVCRLDDKHLPCVPPVSITIPQNYPFASPTCKLIEQEYTATAFLQRVQAALVARIAKLPRMHSLSHLLDTWEMSVRQACAPVQPPGGKVVAPTTISVRLGV